MAVEEPSHLPGLIEVGAYWKHKVALTAVKLDLFTTLAGGPRDAAETAGHFWGKAEAFRVFLDALVALGLLKKEGGRYANSSFADTHLVQGREGYKGDQLFVDDVYWGLWGKLEETLMTGASPLDGSLFHTDPQATERLVVGLAPGCPEHRAAAGGGGRSERGQDLAGPGRGRRHLRHRLLSPLPGLASHRLRSPQHHQGDPIGGAGSRAWRTGFRWLTGTFRETPSVAATTSS